MASQEACMDKSSCEKRISPEITGKQNAAVKTIFIDNKQ